MRTIFTSIIALLAALTSGAAYSADKGGPAPAAAAPAVVELAPHFQGLYVGALVGHSSGGVNTDEGFKIPREGYAVTGLIGYNHRVSPHIALGIEGDFGVTDVAGSTNAAGFTVTGSNRYVASLRARAGYILGASMLYGTAGLATTNQKLEIADIGGNEKNTNGYVFGGGLESMLFGNMGVRVEVLRYQWADQGFTIQGMDTGKLGSHDTQVRAGLVFRLN